jgi:hypothetical protein
MTTGPKEEKCYGMQCYYDKVVEVAIGASASFIPSQVEEHQFRTLVSRFISSGGRISSNMAQDTIVYD